MCTQSCIYIYIFMFIIYIYICGILCAYMYVYIYIFIFTYCCIHIHIMNDTTSPTLLPGLNTATMVWVGPAQEDITSDFMAFFKRKVACEADIFANEDEEHEVRHTRSLHALRRKDDHGDPIDQALLQLDPDTGTLMNYSCGKHLSILEQMCAAGHRMVGPDGGCAADVSQNPHKRKRAGPIMPSMMKSSVMVNVASSKPLKRNHIFTCGLV